MAQLTATPAVIDNSTFMLIPNAGFYNARSTIVGLVEGQLSVAGHHVHAVYPEREYRNEHPPGSWGRVAVHGHHVLFTYRHAAHLTDKILRGKMSVGTLPAMKEAEQDQ